MKRGGDDYGKREEEGEKRGCSWILGRDLIYSRLEGVFRVGVMERKTGK